MDDQVILENAIRALCVKVEPSNTFFDLARGFEGPDIGDYVRRLNDKVRPGPSTNAVAALYLHRLLRAQPHMLSARAKHRVALALFVIAHKMADDCPRAQAVVSRAGGVELAELNRLETSMVQLLGFRLAYKEAQLAVVRALYADADGGAVQGQSK